MNEILKDFSTFALVDAIEANLFDFFPLYRHLPQAEVHDAPDMLWTITDIPFPLFNNVLRVQVAPENVDTTITTAVMRCKSMSVPLLWWTGPNTRPVNLGTSLERHGFSREDDETGMAVDLVNLNDNIPIPAGLVIEQVSDLETLKQWNQVFTLGFGIPEPFVQAFFDLFANVGVGAEAPLYYYIGRYNGEPIATSLLLLSAGVAGIYCVATLPNARRQGMGAAVTLSPLLAARERGYLIGILQASEIGKNVYQRLGFQEYCKIGQYIWTGE